MDKKRILVIGGASLKASEFIKKELDLGIEVVCLDNLSSSDIKNIEEFNKYPNFVFINHDINIPFFIVADEVYSFITNDNENIKRNIRAILEKNKIENKKSVISIVGTGYVGLTTAAILSNVGYKVYCIDVDEKKIDIVKSGKSYFYEPGMDEFVKKGIESGNLIPTTDYSEAIGNSDIAFICVGTPSNDDGSVNLSYVLDSAIEIVKNIKNNFIIVQKSTVQVNTNKKIKKIIEEYKNGYDINLVSCPEFLREGSAIFDTLFFDRLVVGGNNIDSMNKIIEIYREIDNYAKNIDYSSFNSYAFHNINPKYIEKLPDFDKRVVVTNIETAELIKTTANSFLALKISFANMISRLCDRTGAESDKLMDGIGLDPRIGRAFLYPGLGYGGGCFPKDINGMIQTANFYDVDCDILESADVLNNNQVYFALYKIKKLLGEDLCNKKIAFLGLSFKPGTSDVRKSPSIRLINKLLDEGAIINAYDPEAIEESKKELNHKNLKYADKIEDVFNDADCIVLGTEWKEFVDFDYSKIVNKMKHLNFLDGRNVMDIKYLKNLNFKIERF